jgi:hypothetical protein
MYYSTQHLDLEISFRAASLMRVIQVFGLGFLFVPITLVSYVGMPAGKSNSVAGLVNFMRNIGSSIGTSMVTTLIARREQFHQVYLAAHATAGQPVFVAPFRVWPRDWLHREWIPRGPLVRLTVCFIGQCSARRLPSLTLIRTGFSPWERESCSYCPLR